MANYFPSIYRQLEAEIDTCIEQKIHLLIITLPGLGATHLLQHYLKNHPKSNINYLNSANNTISDTYNFIDFDNNQNDFIDQVENYFKNANYQQKFALIINQPSILLSDKYLNSTLPRRFIKTFYLPAYSQADIEIFVKDINPKISKTDLNIIYRLSAGIPRLAKFFCTNPDRDSPLINNIISPTISAIAKTNKNILQKLNIDINHPTISQFLKSHQTKLDIKMNFDLSFVENGQVNPNTLNKIEAKILNYLIENNGQISREKIAQFKWGENQYDEFSDLAITKTMRRLKHKLSVCTLKTISKVGYQLVTN